MESTAKTNTVTIRVKPDFPSVYFNNNVLIILKYTANVMSGIKDELVH